MLSLFSRHNLSIPSAILLKKKKFSHYAISLYPSYSFKQSDILSLFSFIFFLSHLNYQSFFFTLFRLSAPTHAVISLTSTLSNFPLLFSLL